MQLVESGSTRFYVELAEAGGPQTVGLGQAMSLQGVRDTIEAVAREMASVWDRVKPDSASFEFGVALTAKSGVLTGLIVDADGSATLKVTINWGKAATA
ncbi:CU044_2847 family protein [Streptomyces massasporeus]|uniref:CU044_2847 family protein n=1 Tax=Streptomyces massasporeus TaxID=67324 RepID=UPI0036779677